MVEGGARVLIVEDEPTSRAMLTRWLRAEGYVVQTAASGEDALESMGREPPSVICLDLGLPGISGVELVSIIKERCPAASIIILTAERDIDVVVDTVQRGAHDYLLKPVDHARVLASVARAVARSSKPAPPRDTGPPSFHAGRQILGSSQAMDAFLRELARVAASEVTVMIHGESGTGKELAARAIHEGGPRARGPFIALNCAAIPESLQESEFFGHERGAFTGAIAQRKGALELADHGTFFLDEVGELSPALQAKLLRALQERTFRRVGGSQDISADFRLLSATHRDLVAESAAGRFRADLFFRLTVFELELPPLRDRAGDVSILARAFLESSAPHRKVSLATDALEALEAYPWPGNVRELENAILRALVVCQGDVIHRLDLPARVRTQAAAAPIAPTSGPLASASGPASAPASAPALGESMAMTDVEKRAIESALQKTRGNVSEAGRLLGIGRTTIYRLMKKYGLNPRTP